MPVTRKVPNSLSPLTMDARLRIARLAMGLALVGEVAAEIVLALQHRARGPGAGRQAPFEIVGHAGRDLLDIGLVEGLAEAAEQLVDGVGHGRSSSKSSFCLALQLSSPRAAA